MKVLIKTILAVGFVSLIAWPTALQAGGPGPVITLDEFGMSSGTFGGLPSGFSADPTVMGGPAVLTYVLPFDITSGDLVLLEPDTNQPSDLLRFIESNPNAGGANTVLFYSDNEDGVDAPADVGLPPNIGVPFGSALTFFEVGPEGMNGFTYIPGPGDPGAGIGPAAGVVYTFISDSVPEPSICALLGLGAMGLLAGHRRLKR
jgi:PEP-CTERM motif